MYAVIESGGKQYRVAVGDRLRVESIKAEPGESVSLSKVLLVADGERVDVGSPHLDTPVEATVVGHGRGRKIRILKFRRRKNSRTHAGHRQNYTELEITSIGGAGAKPGKKAAAPAAPASEPDQEATTAVDDLTAINGIGPVIADKLRDLGITTVRQIAELTAEDIAEIDEKLNFKGRIEREDWVAQAQQLLAGDDAD